MTLQLPLKAMVSPNSFCMLETAQCQPENQGSSRHLAVQVPLTYLFMRSTLKLLTCLQCDETC